jgi:putative transposase
MRMSDGVLVVAAFADAAVAALDDIEQFYNTTRRHSTIGYLSLVEFEKKVGLA